MDLHTYNPAGIRIVDEILERLLSSSVSFIAHQETMTVSTV